MSIKYCSGPNCDAPVDFFKNENGRTVIVDAKPIKVWVPDVVGVVVLRDGYVDHHVTCPDSKKFRKKKEGDGIVNGPLLTKEEET